jgi:hypothetical protein
VSGVVALTPLERVVRRAPLALRLTDLATGAAVSEGLVIAAWPADDPTQVRTTASVSPKGVGGFHRLPGLADFEDGSTTRASWFASPPEHPPVPFVVRVVDGRGEHLPVLRQVAVPAEAPVEVALPRSPAAAVPSGFLSVAAGVVTEAGDPAAWAVVELDIAGFRTGGVADARGIVVVPVPRAVPPSDPGTPAGGPSWEVTGSVRYRPADHEVAPGAAADDPPTLTSLLSQLPALVVDDGQLVGTLRRDLTAAGPLVLASEPGPTPTSTVLVIRPTP